MPRRALSEEQIEMLFFGSHRKVGLVQAIHDVYNAGRIDGMYAKRSANKIKKPPALSAGELRRVQAIAAPVLMRIANLDNTTVTDILSGATTRAVARSRDRVQWVLRVTTRPRMQLREIAAAVGLSDHSSVVSAISRIDRAMSDDDKRRLLGMFERRGRNGMAAA